MVEEKKALFKKKERISPKKKSGKNRVKGLGIHSIRVRLLAAFAVPILCLIVLGCVSYFRASEILVENSVNNMNQTIYMTSEYYRSSLEYIRSKVDVFYNETQDYVKGRFNLSEISTLQMQNATRDTMKGVVYSDSNINGIYVLTPHAQPLSTNGHEDEGMYDAFLATDVGKQLFENPRTYYWYGPNPELDAILGVEEGSYLFRMAMAFKGSDAFLISEVKEDVVLSIMETLDFGEGSIMGMISHDGTEIAYVNEQSVLNGGYFADKVDFSLADAETETTGEDAASETLTEEEPVYVELEGKKYLFLENDVVPGNLKVCVLVPEKNLLEQTAVIRNITVVLVVIACALALVTGLAFANNIGGVIAKINRHLDKVANGDLTVRLKMKGKDEFAVLADSVNHMTDNVANLVGEVRMVGSVLLGIVQEVAKSTNHFVHSTSVIKTSVKEIEDGVAQLDESSVDSLSQMEILSSQFTQLNANTSSIGKATDCTVETINESLTIMEELNEKTSETTSMMNKVSDTMEILQTKITEINEIVDAIDDIASQTTLLSLNASIEAARAGESGRGFGVVADEIRKLADQSMHSADEIRNIITEITTQTTVASKSVENACDSVEKQKNAVDRTTNSFHSMDEQTRILTQQIREILGYIQTMEDAKSTTEDAIQSISAATSQTAASSSEVYNTAETQSNEALTLKQASEEMLNQANQLEEAIQKFTV